MKRLQAFVTENSLALQVKAHTWKDAVTAAGELLVAQNICDYGYINAMVEAINQYGAYMVISPGVALVHSRPDKSVRKTGISLINLAEGVNFGNENNDPVSLVIAFAAADDEMHIQLLQQLANLLLDEDKLHVLMTAKEKNEVLEVIAGPVTGLENDR